MIEINGVNYNYNGNKNILENINLKIKKGEIVSIIGKNGSGKSTLARLIAGITMPNSGEILVCGIDTKNKKDFIELRKKVGIVFQNPENQIIFNNVHDDILFALDNLKLDKKEERIKNALKEVGMEEFENSPAYDLSLGQKQRITIAGILSVKPEIIVMDEPTAMLDPEGKNDIKKIVKKLKEDGYTVIYITNIIDEILISDRIIVLEKGKIIKEFEAKKIFDNINLLKEKGITIPKIIELKKDLEKNGINIEIDDLI